MRTSQLARIVALFAALVFLPSLSHAACGVVGSVYTAASSSYTDVNACVSLISSDGYTLVIPAGSSTWTSTLSMPCNTGTIQGNGQGSTNITVNGAGINGIAWNTNVTGCSAKSLRITAMSMIVGASGVQSCGLICLYNSPSTGLTGQSFRIDHITFTNTSGAGARWLQTNVPCVSPGCVADHNTITDLGSNHRRGTPH